jgi:hypothetical protein
MPYTVWSRSRLLGETDLGFVQVYSNMRMGRFSPSPLGASLMSVLTGTGPALHKVGRMMRNPLRAAMRRPEDNDGAEWPRDIRSTTAYADLVSSVDELEALELQLRDSAGCIMETEHIGIEDSEFKKSLIPKRVRRELELDLDPWEGDHPDRYRIQVYFPGAHRLLDDDEIRRS